MLMLQSCVGCGHTVFPARQLCHRCGGAAWQDSPCAGGVIETVTAVRPADPVHLATVRTPEAVRLIVRLASSMAPGANIVLHEDGGAVWGTIGSGQGERP